jgi:hypothetical protein
MSTHSILVGVCELRMETRKELTQQIIIWAGLKCAHPVGPSTILSWIGYTQPVAISALVFFSVKKHYLLLRKGFILLSDISIATIVHWRNKTSPANSSE